MASPVSLAKVVDEIDKSIEGYQAFINRRTGELFGADVELAEEEDGDEGLPAWARRAAAKVRTVAASPDWLALPNEFRCEDLAVLERYCKENCTGKARRELLAAIQGGTPLGLMKTMLGRLGLYEDWEGFRQDRIAERAAAWLAGKKIAFRK